MKYILLLFAISLSIYSQDNDTVYYNVKGHGVSHQKEWYQIGIKING